MSKKKWDSDWVHFSKRARRGVIVLLLLFIAVAVSPRLYYNYIYSPPEYEIQVKPLAFDEAEEKEKKVANQTTSRYSQPKESFDPNSYSLEEWKSVGLSEKQAASILKYLGSGAVLKVKSDLKKLYVVDDELYNLLVSKIDLPDTLLKEKSQTYEQDSEQFDQVESKEIEVSEEEAVEPMSINTATAWDLKRINGIGPYFAKEIIKIREDYGGIISYDQLFDIYRMDKEKLEEIKSYLIIDENEVKKLNINKSTEKELSAHPMISYDMAKSIVYFRENHQPYKRIDEVLLSPYIDRTVFKKLKPYLTVE